MQTDTAHQTWNTRWSSSEGRAEWLTPDPEVRKVAERLAEGSRPVRALDLGCGIGRHALMLAALGFETTAVDMAEEGLAALRRAAESEGLIIATHAAPMIELPFAADAFDYVLAFNVIYHGDRGVAETTFGEVGRILRPGGTFQATMLSKRNHGFGLGTEISPNTFVREAGEGDDSDKIHPHFYCNAAELVTLLADFELVSLHDVAQKRPGHMHWQFVAERLG